MVKVYVVKKGGSFLARSGKFQRELDKAWLISTRDYARSLKQSCGGTGVYRMSLGVKQVEKVR